MADRLFGVRFHSLHMQAKEPYNLAVVLEAH